MNKATTYNLPSVVVIGCRLVLLAIPSWSCLPDVLRMVCIKSNTMLKHTAEVRPSGWRRKASKERCGNISEKEKVANIPKGIYLLCPSMPLLQSLIRQ